MITVYDKQYVLFLGFHLCKNNKADSAARVKKIAVGRRKEKDDCCGVYGATHSLF